MAEVRNPLFKSFDGTDILTPIAVNQYKWVCPSCGLTARGLSIGHLRKIVLGYGCVAQLDDNKKGAKIICSECGERVSPRVLYIGLLIHDPNDDERDIGLIAEKVWTCANCDLTLVGTCTGVILKLFDDAWHPKGGQKDSGSFDLVVCPKCESRVPGVIYTRLIT
jgi:transcription elongation factor Elf1